MAHIDPIVEGDRFDATLSMGASIAQDIFSVTVISVVQSFCSSAGLKDWSIVVIGWDNIHGDSVDLILVTEN